MEETTTTARLRAEIAERFGADALAAVDAKADAVWKQAYESGADALHAFREVFRKAVLQ